MAAQGGRGRVLVAYYSRTGNTARVARDIAIRLGADLEEIRDKIDRTGVIGYCRALWDSMREAVVDIVEPRKDPAEYSLTVVGTPVWAWRMAPAVRAYLRKIRGRAGALGFFVTSGATDARQVVPRMEEAAGCEAVASTGFDAMTLKDPLAYEKRISVFVATLAARTSARAAV